MLYVDDIFFIGSQRLIVDCNRDLALEFDMNDLRLMHYFFGLEMWQGDGDIFI